MPTNLDAHPTSTTAHSQLAPSLMQKEMDYRHCLCLFIEKGRGHPGHARLAERGKSGATLYPTEHPVQIAAILEWHALNLRRRRQGEGKRKTCFDV
jgi:hypothetical protein